jgi:hypothetical protein
VFDNALRLSLFSLFFSANYQPSTLRAPRKSWGADGLVNDRTVERLAVLFAVSVVNLGNTRSAKAALPPGNGFSAPCDEIRMLRQYHNCYVFVNLAIR